MGGEIVINPRLAVEKLQRAMNARDIDAFIECFDPLYYSEEPAHPERAFRGRERLRIEWSAVFRRVPDFHAEILRLSGDRDVVWTEWRWSGSTAAKATFDMRGVTILGVRDNHFLWGRLYMQSLREPEGGMKPVTG